MSDSKIAIIIPFVDSYDTTATAVEYFVTNTSTECDLVLIDNGSDENYEGAFSRLVEDSNLNLIYLKNEKNICALPTFPQGFHASEADILCYFHNDVLIHEYGWDQRVIDAFNDDVQLGLAGLFGAYGVHPNGGRDGSGSNMLGKVWGSCECHVPAAIHHGSHMTGIMPSVVFDSLSMFFRRTVMERLINETDSFDDWRSPSHFYDRFLGMKVIDLGYHMATIGIAFDHWGGGTSTGNNKYKEFLEDWLSSHGHDTSEPDLNIAIYKVAEYQWLMEYGNRLPVYVDEDYNLTWGFAYLGPRSFSIM
jgi:hypothetical protein